MPENNKSPVNIKEPVILRFTPVSDDPIPNNKRAWIIWEFAEAFRESASKEKSNISKVEIQNICNTTFHISLYSSGTFVSPCAP